MFFHSLVSKFYNTVLIQWLFFLFFLSNKPLSQEAVQHVTMGTMNITYILLAFANKSYKVVIIESVWIRKRIWCVKYLFDAVFIGFDNVLWTFLQSNLCLMKETSLTASVNNMHVLFLFICTIISAAFLSWLIVAAVFNCSDISHASAFLQPGLLRKRAWDGWFSWRGRRVKWHVKQPLFMWTLKPDRS